MVFEKIVEWMAKLGDPAVTDRIKKVFGAIGDLLVGIANSIEYVTRKWGEFTAATSAVENIMVGAATPDSSPSLFDRAASLFGGDDAAGGGR